MTRLVVILGLAAALCAWSVTEAFAAGWYVLVDDRYGWNCYPEFPPGGLVEGVPVIFPNTSAAPPNSAEALNGFWKSNPISIAAGPFDDVAPCQQYIRDHRSQSRQSGYLPCGGSSIVFNLLAQGGKFQMHVLRGGATPQPWLDWDGTLAGNRLSGVMTETGYGGTYQYPFSGLISSANFIRLNTTLYYVTREFPLSCNYYKTF